MKDDEPCTSRGVSTVLKGVTPRPLTKGSMAWRFLPYEMFTMMKYLNEQGLERHGIDNFDAFAANFGEIIANMEIDPTGKGFRLNRRFAKFCNLPELVTLFRQVADVVNIQDIADLDIPKHISGKPNVVTVYPSEAMEEYIDELVERARLISQGNVNPKEDNMRERYVTATNHEENVTKAVAGA
ncbi:hypothetical protein ACV3RS_16440 [Clostridium perfringens]